MTMKETYLSMGIGEKTYEFCEKIEQDLKERFCEIDKVAEQNQMKVLGAMQKNHVSEACCSNNWIWIQRYGKRDIRAGIC